MNKVLVFLAISITLGSGASTVQSWLMHDQLNTLLAETHDLRARTETLDKILAAGKLNYRLKESEWAKIYAQYNEDYFAGQLPRVRVYSKELEAGTAGQTDDHDVKNMTIAMNPLALLGPKHAREVLLHEMIHVKLAVRRAQESGGSFINVPGFYGNYICDANHCWSTSPQGYDPHGADFEQELHRLIGLGAFDDLLS
jgi:hypothetical protein